MPDLQNQIEQIVADAAARITALVQQAAVDSIASTLGALAGHGPSAQPVSRARGAVAASSAAARPARTGKRGKGEKRPAGEIEATMKKVGDFIGKNPGLRIEQINAQLGTNTKELQLPLRKLVADKAIKTKGAKRSTTYFAGKAKA